MVGVDMCPARVQRANDHAMSKALVTRKRFYWHWEFMFARPRHGYDLQAQHELLTRIAELVDAGRIRTTLAQTLTPINAATLREAHRIVETGHALGKIVVTDPE